jgi:hypothetical protein
MFHKIIDSAIRGEDKILFIATDGKGFEGQPLCYYWSYSQQQWKETLFEYFKQAKEEITNVSTRL